MENIKTMEEAMLNPDLNEVVQVDNELKTFVVDYVGKELQPESGNVTVEMVIDVLASHFPELVFALAEENFIRGYEQAADDLSPQVEEFERWKMSTRENAPLNHVEGALRYTRADGTEGIALPAPPAPYESIQSKASKK
jgi:hypothetical protein